MLVLYWGNCSMTKLVLFETLLIHLFAWAASFFFPLFCWNLFCASALPWLKPRLIAFISVVWYHNCIETQTNVHKVCSYYTRFAQGTSCSISKWICMDQTNNGLIDSEASMLLSAGTKHPYTLKGWLKEYCSVLLAVYTGLVRVWMCAWCAKPNSPVCSVCADTSCSSLCLS